MIINTLQTTCTIFAVYCRAASHPKQRSQNDSYPRKDRIQACIGINVSLATVLPSLQFISRNRNILAWHLFSSDFTMTRPTSTKARGRKLKDLRSIKLDFRGGEMFLVGRSDLSLPYISIQNGGVVPDKDVRRLRNWCNEILGE